MYRKYNAEVPIGQPGHVSESGWEAPRLARSLLEGRVGTDTFFQTDFEREMAAGKRAKATPSSLQGDLSALLMHVQDRLYLGVNEAWFSAHGYDQYPNFTPLRAAVPRAPKDEAEKKKYEEALTKAQDIFEFWNDPEELWARAFVERFLFAAYGNPGLLYAPAGGFLSMLRGFPRTYPLTGACEHLSSFCVLSRGFSVDDIKNGGLVGLSCSTGNLQYPAFDMKKSKTSKALTPPPSTGNGVRQKDPPTFAKTEVLVALGIAPAGVVAFNPGGGGYTGQDLGATTHIASVLRISGKRIQFIDTGVLVPGGGGHEGGTTDHGFIDGGLPADKHCVLAGVLKSAPKTLDECAKAMQGSRPIGCVRLVIADTTNASTPTIRFVSKMLHMRVALSSLIWSLRGLPVEGLSLFWFVYIPQQAAATEALMKDDALSQKPKFTNASSLLLTHVLRGEPNGTVTVFRRKKEKGKDVWVQNFDASEKPGFQEMGLDYVVGLDAPKALDAWCRDPANADLRFYRGPGKDDVGSSSNEVIKKSAADPTFFDS